MKFPLWATLFTLLSLTILCSLGTWQLYRLEWKRVILERLEAEYARNPLENRLRYEDFRAKDLHFVRGAVRGRFLHLREIPLAPRTLDGRPGYHILTPFELEEGGTILINRGWVPLELKTPNTRPESLVGGTLTITGLFRQPERANPFIPNNAPQTNDWYRIDLEQIAQAKNLDKPAPVILYAEHTANEAAYPVPSTKQWRPNNNHFAYACFWFSMAVILIAVYWLRFLRKPKNRGKSA